MTTNEVAEKCGAARSTVRKWCKSQTGLNRVIGNQGVMEYELTDTDVENFMNRRRSRGRPIIENPKRPRKSKKNNKDL